MKTEPFNLEIMTHEKVQKLSVMWVELESENGSSFTVACGHKPVITILKPRGTVSYLTSDGNFEDFEITSGLFSFTQGQGRIIIDS